MLIKKRGEGMKITVKEIGEDQEEEIIVMVHEIHEELFGLLSQIQMLQKGISGYKDGRYYHLYLQDIYYFEVVDGKSFLYTKENVYTSRLKLYEFEELTEHSPFFRCSKSMVLNSDKIVSIRPTYSGRFEALLSNSEKIAVSRQYVPVLKKKIGV